MSNANANATISPTLNTAVAWIQVGEEIIPVIITDIAAFKAWLAKNSDAADTTQLQANDAAFAAAIAEEQALAAGNAPPAPVVEPPTEPPPAA